MLGLLVALAILVAVGVSLTSRSGSVPASNDTRLATSPATSTKPNPTTSTKPGPATSIQTNAGTLFGSTLEREPGYGSGPSLTPLEVTIGTPQAVRLFYGELPESWQAIGSVVGEIPVVVSFKASPLDVISGRYDVQLKEWFLTAPRDRPTWWIYYHEPEDQIESGEFTAQEFKLAWQHISELARLADNSQLQSTVVLMCWTLNPASGRDWHDYVAPGTMDTLAWDCYNSGSADGLYKAPDLLLGVTVAASAEAGARWGVAEFGSALAPGDDGRRRARWLSEVGAFCIRHQAAFATYFNVDRGDSYVLRDAPSQAALRDLMSVVGSPQASPSSTLPR